MSDVRLTQIVPARENSGELREQIERGLAETMALTPDQRRRMIEPFMAFLYSVNKLSDDQVSHLATLRAYHATLTELIEKGADR